ncbi:hypothetical protein [Victivallis sp. Marseille-Q1083]|uniref:hypothetical protein n=1 Tax=Victivallis sp. Marseille-Q1083 TaxID=2717288 RepID=UPI0015897F09|nr:hypothetical protein [Victivallis sp. Marseille-Q1083]
MAEENSITLEERDLAARLVRMGAAAPMPLDGLTRERLDEMVNNLPEIYHGVVSGLDSQRKPVEISMFDASRTNLQKRAGELLQKQAFADMPTGRISVEYSPDAWKQFLHSSPDVVDLEALQQNLRRWNFPVSDAGIRKAFEPDLGKNLAEAEKIYRAAQIDLFSRMVRMGLSKPVDMAELDFSHIEREIDKLPLLAVAEIAMATPDGGVRHLELLDVVDYSRSSHLAGENQYGFDYEWESKLRSRYPDASFEEIERARYREEMEREEPLKYPRERKSGIGSDGIARSYVQDRNPKEQYHLELQERAYFAQHPEWEDRVLHKTISYRAGVAWLDYFKQGIDAADPIVKADGSHSFRNLQSGLKNWELKFSPSRLADGFEPNPAINLREAQLLYHREIIAKTVSAGVIPPLPLEAWRKLSPEKAEEIVNGLPMLLTQARPADWLDTLNVAGTPENITGLELLFEASGIPFDQDKIRATLPAPQSETNERRTKMAAYELTNEDYQNIASGLIASGRLEMTQQQMRELSPDFLKDLVQMNDTPASIKQKVALSIMAAEGRVKLSQDDIENISGSEARIIFKNVPNRNIAPDPDAPAVTDRTRQELRRLMDKGLVPRMQSERWKILTEPEARQMINITLALAPATENQKQAVREMLKAGGFDGKALAAIIPSPTIGEREIATLSMGKASKILGLGPASEEQIKRVEELIADRRIEPVDTKNLTKGTASEILDAAYSQSKPHEPDDPATGKQLARIQELIDQKRIEPMSKTQLEKINFGQAREILANAPASSKQKNAIRNMVEQGRLEPLSKYENDNLTFAEASKLLDIGSGKSNEAQVHKQEPDGPATENQLAKLEELHKTGKIDEIPTDITKKQASEIIGKAVQAEPITIQQEGMLRKWMERGMVPVMSEKKIAAMTQGTFRDLSKDLMAKAAREPGKETPEPGRNKAPGKTIQEPAMSR